MNLCHTEQNEQHTGCLICGKPLVYESGATWRACALCGQKHPSNAACRDGHFICDRCHASEHSTLVRFLKGTEEKDPIRMFLQAVTLPGIHMHGPEHHSIVPGVLLAAYRNNGGSINFDEAIESAVQRGGQVPGGICGFWGICGASAGAGIYASIVTGSDPLNEAAWNIPQFLAARCLNNIAKIGGPRCCKRTSRIAIETAVRFTEETLGVCMPAEPASCRFPRENGECLSHRCPYFNVR